jgi:hypothetical protein
VLSHTPPVAPEEPEVDGLVVGAVVGLVVGAEVGLVVGGAEVGAEVGLVVGADVGLEVGLVVGAVVGAEVGLVVGAVGGAEVGAEPLVPLDGGLQGVPPLLWREACIISSSVSSTSRAYWTSLSPTCLSAYTAASFGSCSSA